MKTSSFRLFCVRFAILTVASAAATFPASGLAQTAAAPAPAASAAQSAATTPDPALTAELQKAADRFNAADFASANELLVALCTKKPELAPPSLILAQWFAQAGQAIGVRASLERTTAEYANDPEAFLLLGEIALKQQELTAAELLLREGENKLAAFTANAERKTQMQKMLLKSKIGLAEVRQRWSDMEKLADAAMKLEPTNAELTRQKGIALFQQKKDAEAKTVLQQADQLVKNADQKGLPADAIMSQLYLLRNDVAAARQSLTQGLIANPKSKEMLALLVLLNLREDKLDEAKQVADRLLAEDANSAESKRLAGSVALFVDDYAVAEKLFQSLVIESPSDAAAVNGLTLALCEQDDQTKLKRALEYAAENVRRNENQPEYLGTLGWVLYKAKAFDDAAKVLRQAASGGEVNAANAYYLARLAVQAGQNAEAIQLLKAAVSSSQPFAKKREAQVLLGVLQK